MATTPIIQSSGSTSGPGTAGQGRNNLVPGETVTLSDTAAANAGGCTIPNLPWLNGTGSDFLSIR